MCHDGAGSLKNKTFRFLMKAFVWRMVTAGYSIASINGVEFRDSKVWEETLSDHLERD